MRLISPPKWPSVNPFSHPLGSKTGRKPMVNPSKWANLKSNFLKFYHRNQVILGIEKARKMAYFRAFLAFLSCRLSLAELRCATSGFEAVLLRKALNYGVFNSRKKRHKSRIKRTLSCFQMHASSKIVCFGMLTFALSRTFLCPRVVNLSSDSRHSRVTSPSPRPASSRGPRPTDSGEGTQSSASRGRAPPAQCRRRSAQPYRYVNPPSAFTGS